MTHALVWVAGLLLLLTAGCGKHYWGKPGASFRDFSEDNRQCAQQHAVFSSANKDYGIVMLDAYRSCLKGRGWARKQMPEPTEGWFRGIENDSIVRLDAPPSQREQSTVPAVPYSTLPLCERGATSATARDGQGRWRCRLP